mmetsp:Transcript_14809/g.22132  ORF Transcript_14809/g.22132 Transcript_14809/m.22132 type:complete len:200 (-) Transcript_14809:1370-1969(-)
MKRFKLALAAIDHWTTFTFCGARRARWKLARIRVARDWAVWRSTIFAHTLLGVPLTSRACIGRWTWCTFTSDRIDPLALHRAKVVTAVTHQANAVPRHAFVSHMQSHWGRLDTYTHRRVNARTIWTRHKHRHLMVISVVVNCSEARHTAVDELVSPVVLASVGKVGINRTSKLGQARVDHAMVGTSRARRNTPKFWESK